MIDARTEKGGLGGRGQWEGGIMKSTWVDDEGNVRCPKCGGKQFTSKRTGKAKWAGALTMGVGLAAMPKRLKCQGCGQNLKTGSARKSEWNQPQKREAAQASHARPSPSEPIRPSRERTPTSHQEYGDVEEVKVRADEVEPGDLLRWADRFGVVEAIEAQRWGNLQIQLDDGREPVKFAPMSKVKVKRLP